MTLTTTATTWKIITTTAPVATLSRRLHEVAAGEGEVGQPVPHRGLEATPLQEVN